MRSRTIPANIDCCIQVSHYTLPLAYSHCDFASAFPSPAFEVRNRLLQQATIVFSSVMMQGRNVLLRRDPRCAAATSPQTKIVVGQPLRSPLHTATAPSHLLFPPLHSRCAIACCSKRRWSFLLRCRAGMSCYVGTQDAQQEHPRKHVCVSLYRQTFLVQFVS